MREAIIRIPHAEFEQVGLGGFVSLCRDAGLRDLTELVCRSDGCLVVVTVDAPMDEEELATLERVEWWERLAGEATEEVYLCKVSFPDPGADVQPLHRSGISNGGIRVDDGGIDVTLVGPQDDLSREISEYDEAGMNVFLRRIADYGGPKDALDALTDRQREVLRTAYELGYFDVPRGASTADVADELGLDASTVAEHLQRAERNLLSAVLQ